MKPVALGIWRMRPLLFVLTLLLAACDSTDPALSSGPPSGNANPDSTPPQDTLPSDSTPIPPDTTGPVDLNHVGIAFGPFAIPSQLYGPQFTGAYRPAWPAESLLRDLEAARRAHTRVLLNFSGSGDHFSDDVGFTLATWKQRVDRFRGLDLTSYIADGTILGHFILDEPSDTSNWNGKQVTPAEVDELARYSKEIWPTMAVVVRAWPAYMKGYQFQYLDAIWAQYHSRFGPIDQFIASNVRDAKASGLALVAGLNVLNGGSASSGIPGLGEGKHAMSASELRSWGGALFSEPYFCALFIWKYEQSYFSRPDIQAALLDLNHQAESRPKQACRRGP